MNRQGIKKERGKRGLILPSFLRGLYFLKWVLFGQVLQNRSVLPEIRDACVFTTRSRRKQRCTSLTYPRVPFLF